MVRALGRIRDFSSPDQLSSTATAWHLGKGLVLTAGHTLTPIGDDGRKTFYSEWSGDPKKIAIDFGDPSEVPNFVGPRGYFDPMGFRAPVPGDGGPYTVKQVITAKYTADPGQDYAILQLAPPWPKASIEVGDGVEVSKGDEVLLLGFNGGIELQAKEGVILDPEGSFFGFSAESITGFSGGPVIHVKSGKAIAIHHGRVGIPNPNYNPELRGSGSPDAYPMTSMAIAHSLRRIPEISLCRRLLSSQN